MLERLEYQHYISVRIGPQEDMPKSQRIRSSVVIATGGKNDYWISTVRLPDNPSVFETLVFAIPLSTTAQRFYDSEDSEFREISDGPLATFNRPARSRRTALRHHEAAIYEAKRVLNQDIKESLANSKMLNDPNFSLKEVLQTLPQKD